VVERYVDGKAGHPELVAAHEAAWQAWGTPARTAASDASAVDWQPGHAVDAAGHAAWADTGSSRADERKAQAHLVRCLWGNPFRPGAPFEAAWRTPTVVALAGAMYEDRTFDLLPILADALEEAGCTDSQMLGHLRAPGSHCRGCWVLDWLTGRG
jgi:hypothetical protein